MKRNKKILIIIVLFLLVRINLSFSILRVAKNSVGNLNTAQWQISLSQNSVDNYLSVVSGDNSSVSSYALDITNSSEVNAVYSVVLNGLPSGVSASIDGVSFLPETNNKIIFSDIGTINSGNTETLTLSFKALTGSTIINDKEIDINVIARQTL